LGLLAAAALLLATLPWWLGATLIPIGQRFYTRFGRYERIGYAQFALNDVAFDHRAVRVTAGRVVADTPLLWLWRHLRRRDAAITADHWRVIVRAPPPLAAGAPIPGSAPNGIAVLHGRLERIAGHLRDWLPRAVVSDGQVHWPKGGFALRQADWNRGILATRGLRWAAGEAEVRVAFAGEEPVQIYGTETDRDWRVQLAWTGPEATGRGWAWSQPLELHGHYGPEGWLPQAASVTAAGWSLPADRAGLGAAYRALQGSGRADWSEGRFQLQAHATAEPKAAAQSPAVAVDIAGAGDRRSWSVQSLQVRLPYAEITLSRPIAFAYGVRPDWSGAALTFAADLGRLPGGEARGRARGTIQAAAGSSAPSDLDFAVTATDAAWRQFAVNSAAVRGTLRWPQLTVSSLEVHLPGGEVSGVGAWDFRTRTLAHARLQGTLAGPALRPWLPGSVAVERLAFDGTASGALGALDHRGQVQIAGLQWAPWRPVDLNLTWRGRRETVDRGTIHLTAGGTAVDAAGRLDVAGARLDELTIAARGVEIWHLDQPARIDWSPQLRVASLRLRGPASALALDLTGGPAGTVAAAASGIQSEWIRGLMALPGPDWTVRSFRLNGHLQDDRLVFGAQVDADLRVPDHPAQISFALDGDPAGLHLSDGRLTADGHPIAQAEGRAPVWLRGTGPSHWGLNVDGPLGLQIDTTPGAPFWTALAGTFGLVLDAPKASVRLQGTLRHPEGHLDLSVARLSPRGKSAIAVPPLDAVRLQLKATADEIELDQLSGQIAGQPLQASGRLPMNDRRWRDLWARRGITGWEEAEGKLVIADADLAPLARLLPEYLSPRGRWNLQAALAHGQLSGDLQVRGAAARPLPGLGRVQSIDADVGWHGRTAEVTALTAQIGGQPIRLSGQADFTTWSAPRLTFTLTGEDVPLVRQPGLLVRADLDLHGAPNRAGLTRISGAITVRDAIQLGDLTDLLPSGQTGGHGAPPYFSVDVPPFNRWPLAVDVKADGTLRIRTSIFSGTASAYFRLGGTLGDPRAVGQINLQRGQISLPFATFDVQSGAVRLAADDPFHPQIDLSATSRRYDYDLRMEVSGSAFDPTVNFTSNPALPSDQVVLLVTTGQVPSAGSTYGNPSAQVAGLGAFVGQNLFQGLGSAGSDRLDVTAGQELSLKGRPTYEVDYKLRERWWLVGEYDEFDEYIGGVKWRVYTDGGAAHAAH